MEEGKTVYDWKLAGVYRGTKKVAALTVLVLLKWTSRRKACARLGGATAGCVIPSFVVVVGGGGGGGAHFTHLAIASRAAETAGRSKIVVGREDRGHVARSARRSINAALVSSL